MAQTNDEIQALVQATIQSKVIQAFNDAPEAIDLLVKAALSKEVDQYGAKPDYNSRIKMPYLEWLVGETIRRVARDAVQEAVKAREATIKEAVKKAISADAMVDGLTKKIMGTLDEEYKVNISFADEEP